MKTEILILKAYHGDCILIKTFDAKNSPFNILIDGGTATTFDFSLRAELQKLTTIDLLILTHIDSDHIGGIIKFLKNSIFDKIEVKKYWINCRNLIAAGSSSDNISYGEAKNLEELLIDKKENRSKFDQVITTQSSVNVFNGLTFTVLSPTPEIIEKINVDWKDLSEEYQKKLKNVPITGAIFSQVSKGTLVDLSNQAFTPQKTIENDIFNSSSIALLIEGQDFSFLSLADSRPEVIIPRLQELLYNDTDNKLKADYVKISHHGSKNNTSTELLDLIDSDNFIISTNGGNLSTKHPDREVIARIIYHPKRNEKNPRTIYFNYPLDAIQAKCGKLFTDEETKDGNWNFSDNVTKLP